MKGKARVKLEDEYGLYFRVARAFAHVIGQPALMQQRVKRRLEQPRLEVAFAKPGDVGRLDPTTEAIAYFVVSEALTNVAKHSGAGHARVDVTRDDERLTTIVTDDGRGGADPALGTGLTGLRQRVTAVDGTLEVESPHGGPTRLTATLPLRTGRSLT